MKQIPPPNYKTIYYVYKRLWWGGKKFLFEHDGTGTGIVGVKDRISRYLHHNEIKHDFVWLNTGEVKKNRSFV